MAIAVKVSHSRTHARLFAAIFIERSSCSHRDVSERTVMVITVKNAGSAVAGDEDVGPSIFVEVQSGDAERVTSVGSIDVRLRGDVFKRAVALVMIENILLARL